MEIELKIKRLREAKEQLVKLEDMCSILTKDSGFTYDITKAIKREIEGIQHRWDSLFLSLVGDVKIVPELSPVFDIFLETIEEMEQVRQDKLKAAQI